MQVAGHEVRVGFEGDLGVRVPKDARDRVEVDAGREEQRRGSVPRVVQAEATRQRLGPQEHPARRAVSPLAVRMLLFVRRAVALAAAAEVQVAVDDAGMVERSADALAELVGLGAHLAVSARKEQRALGRFERSFEVRHQRRRDRHRLLARALRRVVVVGAADREQPPFQIDVALLQPEQLALAQARVERGGDERPVFAAELGEEPRDLVRLEEGRRALRHLARLRVQRGVLAMHQVGATSAVEGGADHAAELVDRRGSEALLRPVLQEQLQPPGRERDQRQPDQVGALDVAVLRVFSAYARRAASALAQHGLQAAD